LNIEGLLDVHELSQYREEDPELMCRSKAPRSRLICTRTMGHGSVHVAHSGEKTVRHAGRVVLGVWGEGSVESVPDDVVVPDSAALLVDPQPGEPLAFTIMVPVMGGMPWSDAGAVVLSLLSQMEYPESDDDNNPAPPIQEGMTIVIGAQQIIDGEVTTPDAEIPVITAVRRIVPMEHELMQQVKSGKVAYVAGLDKENPNG
jgi:hypothetical protein